MREIKFRAWDKEDCKMYQCVTVGCTNDDRARQWNPLIYTQDHIIGGIDHKEFEIMQYTGLKDKNGKEIYEGDIVKYCPNYRAFLAVDEIRNEIKRGVVVWNEQGFYAIDDNYPSNKDYMSYPVPMLIGGLEVIGNIYENLELLEKI